MSNNNNSWLFDGKILNLHFKNQTRHRNFRNLRVFMRYLTAYILAVFSVLISYGQAAEDSTRVYFHIGRWQFDPTLEGNATSMDEFIDRVRVAADSQNLDRIIIRSYASPDGAESFNKRLSGKRCATIATIIEERTGLPRDVIQSHPEGEAWADLRAAVAANPNVPARDKILNILDNTPIYVYNSQGIVVSGRKKKLMDLQGGRPWMWMVKNIFPQLRNALTISLQYVAAPEPEPQKTPEPIDTVSIVETIVSDITAVVPDSCALTEPQSEIQNEIRAQASHEAKTDDWMPLGRLLVKTNMLYYAALMPNIEIEYLCNDRWSVALEADVAWYNRESTHQAYRIAIGSPEVRYWPIVRERWHGMYVGAFAGGAYFDLENGGTGYQGPCAFTGLSLGYMWRIGRHLSLEASLGAGYMRIHAKTYEPIDGHYVYMKTKNIDYLGPLKLKLSLVWHIGTSISWFRKI